MNEVLLKDIEEVIKQEQYFSCFENTSILITGATGLIGSIIAKSLIQYGESNKKDITVYAACRSETKFKKVFGDYQCENLKPIFADIFQLDLEPYDIDYIVHCASITDSKTFVEKPVETISIALDGTRNLLQQCVKKTIKGFVYLSSLEVYGSFPTSTEIMHVTETNSGYLDTMSVRSCYSESKRMVENLCKCYQDEYKLPVRVVRLCQTFGAGVEYSDNRVFAQFARSIIEHSSIVLKTKGETVRNYCYTTDAVTGILTVLAKGENGEAYNIANSDTTISIVDMANKYCSLYPESGTTVCFDICENAEKLGYNPVVKLHLDSTKLSKLGWAPLLGLDSMIQRLVDSMKAELQG